MIVQGDDEPRIEYMLRVLHEFMSMTAAGEATIDYDGTTCDGYCLAVDIENAIYVDAPQEIPQFEGTRDQLDGLSVKG